MDELRRFCLRMLGDGAAAEAAAETGRAAGPDRLDALRAAVSACRGAQPATAGGSVPIPEAPPADVDGAGADAPGLAAAVARELAAATARLPSPQREALALRELLGLSYDELAAVTGSDPAAVGPLLADARLALRAALHSAGQPQPDCDEYERALRTLAARQDEQPVPAADGEWVIEHLGHCRGCAQAHAAMLEASARYRAWAAAEQGQTAPSGTGS